MNLSDLDIMGKRFADTSRDGAIVCGVCDPSNATNRLTWLRYDTICVPCTVDAAANTLTVAAFTSNLFTTGQGEQFAGAPAGVLKDLAFTNLDAGGAAADSPCIFTAYDLQFEVGPAIVTMDASGNQTIGVPTNYDQAYNRELFAEISKSTSAAVLEPNGCRDQVGALDQFVSDGSSRAIGDQSRSGLLGLTRGLRFAICFPGQNAKRPFIQLQLTKPIIIAGNGANPFVATPGGSVVLVYIRATIVGSLDAPM